MEQLSKRREKKKKVDFKRKYGDFSGGPLVRDPPANAGDTD